MTYRFTGLPAGDFERFFGMDDDALLAHGVRRVRADHKPGFPCRVTLRDAEPGETVLLLNHAHLPPPAVYHASGPIFVREGVRETYLDTTLPDDMSDRLYSLRAYDVSGTLRDADVAVGGLMTPVLDRLFAGGETVFVHLHHARHGCFACRVDHD